MKASKKIAAAIVLGLCFITMLAGCSYEKGHGLISGDFGTSTSIPSQPASSSSSSQSQATSRPQPTVKVTDVQFEVPESFSVSEKDENQWYAPDYPYDPSSVTYAIAGKDYDFATHEKSYYEEYYSTQLQAYYTDDIKLKVNDFKHTTLDGWPTIFISLTYQTPDLPVKQDIYLVDIDASYCFTFTDTTTNGDWQAAFEACIKTIRFTTQDIVPAASAAS